MNLIRRPARTLAAILSVAALLAATPALAERADKDKPVNLEADKITVDDAKKIQVFDGNVQMVKGTIIIRTAKLVVTQDAEGFQKAIAYGGAGGLAHFRQKREGKDEYVDGEGERIEYDGKTDKAELFVRAHVTSGLDEVRGPYISYDGVTENYLVTGGAPGTTSGRGERVRAVIQPKNKEAAAPAPASPARNDASLKPAPVIASPRPGE